MPLLLLLVACGGRAGGAPTPFPTAAASPSPTAGGPIALTVTELAAAPGLYRDTVVQVTGLFRKQPILVCDADPFRSPATWGLGEEGLLVPAGGFDQQVRNLLPEGLLMTAEGRWQRWEGLVGCGKTAVSREVWYLNVSRILTPSPLTQVTLTPSGESTAIAEVPTEEIAPPIGPTEDFSFPTPLPEESVTVEPTFPQDDFPVPTDEPFATLPFPTAEGTLPPAATAAATPTLGTPTTGTPTVTGTPGTAGTGTPGVTGTPPATTTAGPGQIITKGSWDDFYDSFITSSLAAGTTDRWDQEVFEDESYHLHVLAPPPADIVVSLLREDQTIIDRQNTAAPGVPEVISPDNIDSAGNYHILVTTASGVATEYAILAGTDPDFPIILAGYVTPGTPRTGVQLPPDMEHYWVFSATAGDEVTITVESASGDMFIDLYGPEAEGIDSIDEFYEGATETLEVTLESTGLHAIAIGEALGANVTYTLSVTR